MSRILYTWGSTWAGTPPWGRYTPWQVHPPGQVPPPGQVHPRASTPPWAGTPPESSACWEIRATSGRYASYWNAFLLYLKFRLSKLQDLWLQNTRAHVELLFMMLVLLSLVGNILNSLYSTGWFKNWLLPHFGMTTFLNTSSYCYLIMYEVMDINLHLSLKSTEFLSYHILKYALTKTTVMKIFFS